MDKDWIALFIQQQNQLGKVLETNRTAERFGLTLSEQDAELIVEERKKSLKEQRRVEFGEGIVPKIIYEFCDSDFIDQNNYVDTIIRLQEIFYLFKNEMQDEITDLLWRSGLSGKYLPCQFCTGSPGGLWRV